MDEMTQEQEPYPGLRWEQDPDKYLLKGSLSGDDYALDDPDAGMMAIIEDVWQAFNGQLSDNACCEIAELIAEGKIKGIGTSLDGNGPFVEYPEGADAAWVADMLDYHKKRKKFAKELDRIEQSKVYGLPIETINGWYKHQDGENDDEQGNSIASVLEDLKY